VLSLSTSLLRCAVRRSQWGQAWAFSCPEEAIISELLLDSAGRRRSPATLPEFHTGRAPRNKGMRYPADPPTIEEIVAVTRRVGDAVHGRRLRGLIVVRWRAGLRIHEALALAEADLDRRRGSLLVRRGKGGRRRQLGMDDWAWEQLAPWLDGRVELPGRTAVLRCQRSDPRTALGGRCGSDGVAPCGAAGRCAAAIYAAPAASRACGRDGARGRAADRHPTPARAHQTSPSRPYLQGIDNAEIIDTVHARRAPMIPVHSSLRV
jgi:integrase